MNIHPEEAPTEALLDGRYRLGACVGQGGMAKVFRAEDLILERTVAIKLLRPGADPAATPARVRTEMTVLAGLSHPSLVTLYDANVVPGGADYLVMEFVEGPSLAERLAAGPLPARELAGLAAELAEALHVVHSSGVVHRDVKPSNVLLAPTKLPGRQYRAKLADFGVAYLIDSTRMTSPGTVIGTGAYLAPEQVRGEAVTPAVDVYALGLLLLEALTGTRAFPHATGLGAVLARLNAAPEIPSWLGPEWGGLLTRMTAADPLGRPAALEVAAVVGALPEVTRPDPGEAEDAARASAAGEATRALPVVATFAPGTAASVPAAAAPPAVGHRRTRRAAARPRRWLVPGSVAAAVLLVVSLGAWALAAAGGIRDAGTTVPVVTEPSSVPPGEVPQEETLVEEPAEQGAGEQVETVVDPQPAAPARSEEATKAADKVLKEQEKAPKEQEKAQREAEKAQRDAEKAQRDAERGGAGPAGPREKGPAPGKP